MIICHTVGTMHLIYIIMLWFAIVSSTPLPYCDNISKDYILDGTSQMNCGLPLSRSYLYSKYNLILLIEDLSSYSLRVGELVSFRIYGCIVNKENELWFDNYTVANTIPMTTHEDCNSVEFDLWSRIVSPHAIHGVEITKSPDSAGCEWKGSFTPTASGTLYIEVLLPWINSHVDRMYEKCMGSIGKVYNSTISYIPDVSLLRGSG